MASHHHHHHHTPPPTATSTHCCSCHNPSSYSCFTPSPPQQQQHHHHHLLEAIASLLSQHQPHLITIPSHHQNHNLPTRHHTHSTISSLLRRIESLESSLNNYTHHSLRHAAARLIQTHFRSFLARRSRTLSQLKHLASIKSTFNALNSSLSNHTHLDFPAISLKAINLLLELDSIQGCDPMIVDGKRSISRDLVQFLDSIEEVALKKHAIYVKTAKAVRSGKKVQKPRNSDDDRRRKLLQNLRGRVEKLSRLCNVSAYDDEGSESGEEGIHDDGVTNANKNGLFLHRQGFQPGVKKSVKFAENRNIYEVYNGDVACSDGSCSSSDGQGQVLENVSGAIDDDDDGVDSSLGAEDDEEVLVVESGGSLHSSDDGERSTIRVLDNEGRNVVEEQFQEKLLFTAPLPLKMESRSGSKNSKGLKILT